MYEKLLNSGDSSCFEIKGELCKVARVKIHFCCNFMAKHKTDINQAVIGELLSVAGEFNVLNILNPC